VGPGEEASSEATDDSTESVGADDIVMDSVLLEEGERHTVVSDSNSWVNSSTGVRSSDEDHGTQGHSDGENSEEAFISDLASGESKSFAILADEVDHSEDESSSEFNEKSLNPGDSSWHQVRELSSTLSSASLRVFNQVVDHAGPEASSNNLGEDHAAGLGEVLEERVFVVINAESPVDEDSNCYSRVVVGTSDGSSQVQ